MPKINAPQIPQTITNMTKAMADQLIHHAKNGNLSAVDTASLRAKIAAAPASAFELPNLKATLDTSLKKVEEIQSSVDGGSTSQACKLLNGFLSTVKATLFGGKYADKAAAELLEMKPDAATGPLAYALLARRPR